MSAKIRKVGRARYFGVTVALALTLASSLMLSLSRAEAESSPAPPDHAGEWHSHVNRPFETNSIRGPKPGEFPPLTWPGGQREQETPTQMLPRQPIDAPLFEAQSEEATTPPAAPTGTKATRAKPGNSAATKLRYQAKRGAPSPRQPLGKSRPKVR